MQKLEKIQEVYDAEIDLIIKQSSLLLQKMANGFNGELKTSGAIVENYLKEIIRKHLPLGFRICSGYIATSESITDINNLIQHDIIIIDDRNPTLYKFGVGDIEIVQAESVCGVIEVKRTLTRKSLKDAIAQLENTKEAFDSYNRGMKSKKQGPATGHTSSPFYGIIGLSTIQDGKREPVNIKFINKTIKGKIHDYIDMIWSLSDGFLLRFCVENNGCKRIPYTVSRQVVSGEASSDFNLGEQDKGKVFRLALSIFRIWISRTRGYSITPESNLKYFGVDEI